MIVPGEPGWVWTNNATAPVSTDASRGRDKPFSYYYGWLLFILGNILTRG